MKSDIIKKTKSMCPKCLKVVSAVILEKDGNIVIKKECKKHGNFESNHIWNKKEIYEIVNNFPVEKNQDAIVLHITSKCNQKCYFCYSKANEKGKGFELSKKEIKNFVRKFKGKNVLLSGGEPTVREDLFDIIKMIKKMGKSIILCSNGKRLADKEYVKKLKESGLDVVNLQFDTIENKNYEKIRGEKLLETKKRTLDNLKKYKIDVYIFVMFVSGINTEEMKKIIDTAGKNEFIKVIYFSNVWNVGRALKQKRLECSDLLEEISKQLKIDKNEILDSTTFAFSLYEILKKIRGYDSSLNPGCELKCYFLPNEKYPIPISRVLDLKKINRVLGFVSRGDRYSVFIKSVLGIPYISLITIKSSIFKNGLKNVILEMLKTNFTHYNSLYLHPFRQLIIRVEPDETNIDLDLTKNYNLYSDMPGSKKMVPACIRHIKFNKLGAPKGASK